MIMSDPAPNPYVGPVPFERKDEHRFYGRDDDLRRLAILFIAKRIVLLYSPSGAGKTSLVQARLIPALEDEGFEVLPVIRVGRQLDNNIVDESGPANIFLTNTIAHLEGESGDDATYNSFAKYWSARRAGLAHQPAVLFFDQFEEVLTVDPHDRDQKEDFFDQLGEALEQDDRLWALFAIREDYLAELDPYRHLIPGKLNSSYRLELLNPHQALDAIQKPADDVGVTFSQKAAEKLVNQLRQIRIRRLDGQIDEPMGDAVEPVQLQVVCQSLWSDLAPETGGEIGPESIAAEGHVDQSLGDFYDKSVARITVENDVDERDIRDWFDRQLITDQGLRGQVMDSGDLNVGSEAIAALVDAHLVRANERRGIQWYELAHDRLVKPVRERNEAWYRTNLSQIQIRAEAWNKTGDDSLLMQFGDLRRARAWAKDRKREGRPLREYEQSFLERSSARQRGRAILGISIGLLLVLIIGLTVGMFFFARDANESASLAQTKEAESVAALVIADHNADVAATSEAEAEAQALNAQTQTLHSRSTSLLPVNRNPTPHEMERSLLMGAQALTTSPRLEEPISARLMDEQARRLLAYRQSNPPAEILTGHRDWVRSVAFSPDGHQLASGSVDDTVRLWDLTASEPSSLIESIVLEGHTEAVYSVDFSPDGKLLASGSGDNTIRLWDLNSLGPDGVVGSIELTGHEDVVRAVAFSPDGQQLASGSADSTIRLWDLTDLGPNGPDEPIVLDDHEDPVWSVAFSPDGSRLASGSEDQTIRLWDVNNPSSEPIMLANTGATALSVAFSPVSERLVSGHNDGAILMWDLTDSEPGHLNEHIRLGDDENPVWSLAFSPDGHQLASGSTDKTIRLWDLTKLEQNNPIEETIVLPGHLGWVSSVAFSRDGGRLVSGSWDNTVRLWDLTDLGLAEPVVLTGHNGVVYAVAFSPDGHRLASGSADHTVRLWDLTASRPNSLTESIVLEGHQDVVYSVAFSPDGNLLASGSWDKTIRLWDLNSPGPDGVAESIELTGHKAWVSSVAFSHDGNILASGSGDNTIRLWDLTDLGPNGLDEPIVLDDHENVVRTVAFSPDGNQLVSGSADHTIRLWDLTDLGPNDRPEPIELTRHDDVVRTVVFSSDGDQLAAGNWAQIHLWDLADLGPNGLPKPVELTGHEDNVWPVAFSPDNHQLASGSWDHTIRLWDLTDLGPNGPAKPIVLTGHEDVIVSLAFSPNGNRLATGGADRTIRLWRSTPSALAALFCGDAGRNFTWDEWQEFLPDRKYEKTCPQYPVHCTVPPEAWPAEFASERDQCSADPQ